jgi:tRNA 2-thiouridine synthesizing protein A
LPALFAKRAILRAAYGNVIEVVCDDPLAAIDVPHMCGQENIEVVHEARDGACVRLWLRRC